MSDDETTDFVTFSRSKWRDFEATPARPDDASWCTDYFALMYELDQEARTIFKRILDRDDDDARKRFAEVAIEADAKHRARLSEWLDSHDWPRLSELGADACMHAWMIALHSDRDPAFMRRVLALLEPLLAEREVDPVHYAALFDRLELAEGRPQRFGMFYKIENGEQALYDLDDPDGVDERRSALGLDDTRFHR